MTTLYRTLLLAAMVATFPLNTGAQAPVETEGAVTESIEVKRSDTKGPKHSSLRFLRDHRVFLRAQLDQLRLQVTREHGGAAQVIDGRYLRLQEMSEELAAARDTVQDSHLLAAQRELMESITQLGAMEAELRLMETLLAEQRARLLMLEEDFLGHQETAMVIVVKGDPGAKAPESVVITEENTVITVPLTDDQRTALAQGGIAQVFHEFVEPRAHTLAVSLTGGAWVGEEPFTVAVDAARDRLTFVELDLSRLDRNLEAAGMLARVWYR